ncbi:MAG: hypothetical protein NTU88_16315, partial [Armatimonadetes bacterium]|nr:hypothetical protein [Armatimonadota bacterium]
MAEKSANWEKMLSSNHDVFGEAAMRRTNGASYEFFKDLLPPLRYVNAAFRHYPITLSAPGALLKPRLISNGSAVNARAEINTWREVGFPVTFTVGDGEVFGADLDRLDGPKLEDGYLPIVQMSYRHEGAEYAEEVFAGSDSPLSTNCAVFVKFSLAGGNSGKVCAKIGAEGTIKA